MLDGLLSATPFLSFVVENEELGAHLVSQAINRGDPAQRDELASSDPRKFYDIAHDVYEIDHERNALRPSNGMSSIARIVTTS